MANKITLTANDGSIVEFYDEIKAQGGVKDVYFSPDKTYVVAGYPAVRRDPQVLVSNIPFCHLRVSRNHGDQFGGGGSLLYVHKAHSF